MNRPTLSILMVAATLLLAGCESDEERAERFYQSALSLMEEGDVDRALVELRNVFSADGFHKEARELYAATVLERGDVQDAYSQYLRLIEQYPDTVSARLTLAEIAMGQGNWEEVERHGTAAQELDPDNVRTRSIAAALRYRTGITETDAAAEAEALEAARAVLDEDPTNLVALRLLIDATVRGRTPEAALPLIDQAIVADPEGMEFPLLKFRVLAGTGDEAGAGAQLESIYRAFPGDEEIRQALITWYLAREDFDAAEALLRELAGEDTSQTAGFVTLVQFLQRARGPEVALAELERLIEQSTRPSSDIYQSIRAALIYEGGDSETAMTILQGLLEDAEPSEDTRRIKNLLAQMLLATGNPVGARALTEEILAEDTTNVDALKRRAAWHIDDDRPDDAINDLRAALGQSPRDADALTLMAQAHERAGSVELAGERLSMAVEASGTAPEESLRYARFLIRQNRTQAAENILLDARRTSPGNLDVLAQLADLRVKTANWTGAQEVTLTLEAMNTEESLALAQKIRAASLIAQNRVDDGLAILQSQVAQSDDPASASATIALTQIRTERYEEARSFLDTALTDHPESVQLRILNANLTEIEGNPEAAEALFRQIIADNPDDETAPRLLYALLLRAGQPDEGEAVLDAALAAKPEAETLLWIKASLLEQRTDIDGAIAIYEAMYARNNENTVVANNLASLIATHRDDPAELDRAFSIARRLRTLEVPAFQDTYGWIESRRGNHEEALNFLEPAAIGLPNDPLVQYHLGMTYAALGQSDAARIALTRAIEIAGDSPLPQFEIARQTLADLPAEGSEAAPSDQ